MTPDSSLPSAHHLGRSSRHHQSHRPYTNITQHTLPELFTVTLSQLQRSHETTWKPLRDHQTYRSQSRHRVTANHIPYQSYIPNRCSRYTYLALVLQILFCLEVLTFNLQFVPDTRTRSSHTDSSNLGLVASRQATPRSFWVLL